MTLGWTRSAAILALAITVVSPALAQDVTPQVRIFAAPAPEAGVGLQFLLLAGGYLLVRRYRRRMPHNP